MGKEVAQSVEPVPMVVLGGYLGSGKTTIINWLLRQAHGRRITVLVNDFGSINIDASLIQHQDGTVISLSNGCICCTIGSSLATALTEIASSDMKRPDLLVVESSGVSNPSRIAQIGLLNGSFRLQSIVVTVDVLEIKNTLCDDYVKDMARTQISSASALVLTKTDIKQDVFFLAHIRKLLAGLAPGVPLFESNFGAVPNALFFDPSPLLSTPNRSRKSFPLGGYQLFKGPKVKSVAWQSTARLSRSHLCDIIRGTTIHVLRAKGIIWLTDCDVPQQFHFAARRILIAPFVGAAEANSVLVFIGCWSDVAAAEFLNALDGAAGDRLSATAPGILASQYPPSCGAAG